MKRCLVTCLTVVLPSSKLCTVHGPEHKYTLFLQVSVPEVQVFQNVTPYLLVVSYQCFKGA